MIAHLKRAACRTASATGLFRITRAMTAHMPRILMYHGFCGVDEPYDDCTRVDVFLRQLLHIKRHYRPMRLSTLGRLIATGRPLPERAVAITVDDGYASFAQYAVPLLSELEIPATLFVVSDFPGTGQWLWTDKYKVLYARAQSLPAHQQGPPRSSLADLKKLTVAERDARLAELAERLAVSIPERAPRRFALLHWRELKELVADGSVEIGAHTRDHPILTRVGRAAAREQIQGSRRELELKLGTPVTTFCYPNGLSNDYSAEHLDMVRDAGFVCATASHIGWVAPESNRFALPRIGGDGGDMLQFRKYLDGFEYWQRRALAARHA